MYAGAVRAGGRFGIDDVGVLNPAVDVTIVAALVVA
jgi:hypothetical protein